MTTLQSLTADQSRVRIRKLQLQFERFGIDTQLPQLIASHADELAAVLQARRDLVDLLRTEPRLAELDSLGAHELEGVLFEIVRLAVRGRLQSQLSEAEVPYPIYNFFAGFDENAGGPWDGTSNPSVATGELDWTLLGEQIRFPIGVPASGLTANSTWVRYFARRGFNVITFKTVRSVEHRPHNWPHWVFVGDVDPWKSLGDVDTVSGDLNVWPKDLSQFSTANSFGVPSPHPDVWRREVERSLVEIGSGQMLIVSVMGSSDRFAGGALIEDFVRAAVLAKSTGVGAIELNLSCPNTPEPGQPDEPEDPDVPSDPAGMAPPVCTDPEMTRQIVEAVRSELGSSVKLVAKLSYVPGTVLEQIVTSIGPHVDAISGINTVQAPIVSPETHVTPFIGKAGDPQFLRKVAGISGEAIRPLGIDFVSRVAQLRGRNRFDIIGMGGVMNAEDVDAYFQAGASAVQSATGACLNPDIAIDAYRHSRGAQRRTVQPSTRSRIAAAVSSGGYSLLSGRGSDD